MTAYDTGTKRSNRLEVKGSRSTYTETKEGFKTTEFWAYIATVVAVVIASIINDNSDGSSFGAEKSLLYISLLTIGYMVSRGLAKAGSREPYVDRDDD